jgi:signal transduction histidine kinase
MIIRIRSRGKLCGMGLMIVLALLSIGLVSCGGKNETQDTDGQIAIAAVHTAAVGLGAMVKDITDENERIEMIRTFIDPIRFYEDETGYFYVYNYDCLNIAHAVDKTLPGKNLYDYQDMRGKYVIRELSAAARTGGGFVTYYWPHPETKKEVKKVGYVEPISGTNYFIGTGYYPK